MTRALLLATVALILGVAAAEYLRGTHAFRRWLGQVVRRGDLVALVERRGIYQNDVERAWQAELFANGTDPETIESKIRQEQKRVALQRLIEQARVTTAASDQAIPSGALGREMDLLRDQFRDQKTWETVLRNAATSLWALRRAVAENLRDRAWIEKRIASQIQPSNDECRHYFEEHGAEFQIPSRLRASHLFLAAPEGYPAEVVEAKRGLIELLSKRLANREAFPALVAEFSEDEATKKRGGDLGYFGQERMLPAVWEAAEKLHPGEISPPVRSRLGFHLLRLTEALPPRALTFEEARPEINTILENRKRLAAVASLGNH
jgi:parvulin-like peptidyl-prolyl isomerase